MEKKVLMTLLLGLAFIFLGLGQDVGQDLAPPVIKEVKESSPAAKISQTFGIEGERAYVTKVVDGDTIEVEMNGAEFKVRLIGIDTPETVDPRRPVGCFGKEASREAKNLLSGKEVIMQKDISESDKYGRLLRYIYLPLEGQLLFVNDYLVRQGFAKILTYPPDVKFNEQFLEAEQAARREKRGLWDKC